MIPFIILALILSVPAQARDFDIPWFQAHPAYRTEFPRRCQDDYRLAQTAKCANAEAAGTRGLGRRLGPPDEYGMPRPFPR